jgi:hypothetical protein
MATRAISIPLRGTRTRSPGLADRLLPVAGLTLSLVLVASLALVLGRLPERPASASDTHFVPASSVVALPTLTPAPRSSWPRSARPLGGLVFVRCTNLWTANADGSNARRLLTMPGLASPAVSPDGRTIAFLGAGHEGNQQVWLAAADGSSTRLLGAIGVAGYRLPSASGLTWSPDGTALAFAMRPPLAGRGSSGWSLWTLTLATGELERVGEGGATPFWLGKQLLAPGVGGREVAELWGRHWAGRRLSEAGDVVGVGIASGWWARWDEDTVLALRDMDGALELSWRPDYWRRPKATSSAPEGYRIDPSTPIAVAEGSSVAVTLVDEAGGKDLGLFDPASGTWKVLDYAWDAAFSPAPTVLGPLPAQRAVQLTRTLLWSLDEAEAGLLLEEPVQATLAPFEHPGFVFGVPRAEGDDGWVVPATGFGRTRDGLAARDLEVLVRPEQGRLVATLRAAGPMVQIRTIDDAVAELDRMLTSDVIAPTGLPAGTRLAGRAISAWTWAGRTEGNLDLTVPGTGRVTFHYGSAGFGCGPSPIPLTLPNGTPAITSDPTESGGWNTIAWPARPNATSGPYGISGEVPTATLIGWATAMDRARLAEAG